MATDLEADNHLWEAPPPPSRTAPPDRSRSESGSCKVGDKASRWGKRGGATDGVVAMGTGQASQGGTLRSRGRGQGSSPAGKSSKKMRILRRAGCGQSNWQKPFSMLKYYGNF